MLQNSEYILLSDDKNTNITLLNANNNLAVSDKNGEAYLIFNKLQNVNKYFLEMTEAPAGYTKLKNLIEVDIENVKYIDENGIINIKIELTEGFTLPTG